MAVKSVLYVLTSECFQRKFSKKAYKMAFKIMLCLLLLHIMFQRIFSKNAYKMVVNITLYVLTSDSHNVSRLAYNRRI